MDLDLSKDPYTHRLARTLDAREIDTILDIGANVGQYATMVRRAGYAGRIISCEPLNGAYGQLSGRAKRDDLWTVLQTAVGRESGTTTINVSANSFSSSVRPMTDAHVINAPGSEYISTETVDVTTVAALVAEHSVDPGRTLLKIDTQGFEDEVLAGAGDHLDEFAAIQLELSLVELYEGQSLFDDHYALMREHGLRAAHHRARVLRPHRPDDAVRRTVRPGLTATRRRGRWSPTPGGWPPAPRAGGSWSGGR